MPQYRLSYSRTDCCSEPIRALFCLTGVPCEERVLSGEQWNKLKQKSVWLNLPILEVDGRVIGGATPICRFVARQTGYAGKTSFDMAVVDSVHSYLEEATKEINFQLSSVKNRLSQQFAGDLNDTLSVLQKMLKNNRGGTGFFAGESMTFVDIWFYTLFYQVMLQYDEPDLLDKYQNLERLFADIHTDPRLESYIADLTEKVQGRKREGAKQRTMMKVAAMNNLGAAMRKSDRSGRNQTSNDNPRNNRGKLTPINNRVGVQK